MHPIKKVIANYSLRPSLLEKHAKTLEWLSATMLWKNELAFFQKVIDDKSKTFLSSADKKKIDHFQNLIIYYRDELVTELRSGLRNHENKLARMLESGNEWDIKYYEEHDALMDKALGISNGVSGLRQELIQNYKL